VTAGDRHACVGSDSMAEYDLCGEEARAALALLYQMLNGDILPDAS
jgi:hypothetical protein